MNKVNNRTNFPATSPLNDIFNRGFTKITCFLNRSSTRSYRKPKILYMANIKIQNY